MKWVLVALVHLGFDEPLSKQYAVMHQGVFDSREQCEEAKEKRLPELWPHTLHSLCQPFNPERK